MLFEIGAEIVESIRRGDEKFDTIQRQLDNLEEVNEMLREQVKVLDEKMEEMTRVCERVLI